MLRALVVYPKEKTTDIGNILRIARAVAQKKESTHKKILVRNILYDSFTQVFVVLYRIPDVREEKAMNE